MKRARFIAAARLEFLAEVIYHNEAQPRLGERFTTAVEEATARALAFPLSGSPSRSNTRRIVVKGFRFSIFHNKPDGNAHPKGQIHRIARAGGAVWQLFPIGNIFGPGMGSAVPGL